MYNKRYNRQNNRLNSGSFEDILLCWALLLCRPPYLPVCQSSLRAVAVLSSIWNGIPQKAKAVKALLIATSEIQAGYKKYQVSKDTNIFIGRTPINDISYDFTDFISREKHAAIHIDSNGTAFIEDLKRSVGVYVNGQLTHSQQLKPFDEIFVMGLSIIYMGGFIAVRDLKTESSLSVMPFFDAKMPIADDKSKQYFVNTPRILKSLDSGEIEVDAPPSPFSADETPVILTLGPSLTMSLVMLASIGVSITKIVLLSKFIVLIAFVSLFLKRIYQFSLALFR